MKEEKYVNPDELISGILVNEDSEFICIECLIGNIITTNIFFILPSDSRSLVKCESCGISNHDKKIVRTIIDNILFSKRGIHLYNISLEKGRICPMCNLYTNIGNIVFDSDLLDDIDLDYLCYDCHHSFRFCMACDSYFIKYVWKNELIDEYCPRCIRSMKKCPSCGEYILRENMNYVTGRFCGDLEGEVMSEICNKCHVDWSNRLLVHFDRYFDYFSNYFVYEQGIQIGVAKRCTLCKHPALVIEMISVKGFFYCDRCCKEYGEARANNFYHLTHMLDTAYHRILYTVNNNYQEKINDISIFYNMDEPKYYLKKRGWAGLQKYITQSGLVVDLVQLNKDQSIEFYPFFTNMCRIFSEACKLKIEIRLISLFKKVFAYHLKRIKCNAIIDFEVGKDNSYSYIIIDGDPFLISYHKDEKWLWDTIKNYKKN